MMTQYFPWLLSAAFAWILPGCLPLSAAQPVELWLTDPTGAARFQPQSPLSPSPGAPSGDLTIEVDAAKIHQSMDGFGYTLTGGSAQHLMRMTPPARAALLRELFATDSTNIGVSYLRVSIGASDLNERVFSYDDLPAGKTDPELARFSLAPDRADLIPVLREILAIQPALKILGSPWSAPVWMKDNHDSRGGSLKREWYDAYARYLAKYVQGMKAEGIPIDAITVQNEPLHPGNNPSMFMPAEDQALFIGSHLGPVFKAAGLATKIICYDHNADRPDYPISVLNDPRARPFMDGSAFHLYAGRIEALSRVHDAYPDKHLYFTEQWIGAPGNLRHDLAWHVQQLVIGAPRNWSRTVLEWNLTSDPKLQPHTDRGGCDRCLGAVSLDGDGVTRNPAYYIIAHASKFVRPGSVRVASTSPDPLPNVAFQTPAGRVVAVVLNREPGPRTFNLRQGDQVVRASLPGGAVATLVW
jgi:glucosylceramidase